MFQKTPVTGTKFDRWCSIETDQFLPVNQLPSIDDVRDGLYVPFYDQETNNKCTLSSKAADHSCYYMGNQSQTSQLEWYNQDAFQSRCEMEPLTESDRPSKWGTHG